MALVIAKIPQAWGACTFVSLFISTVPCSSPWGGGPSVLLILLENKYQMLYIVVSLTCELGERLQLFLPFGIYLDPVLLVLLLLAIEPLLLAVKDEVVRILWVLRCKDRKEVFLRALSPFRVFIGEVLCHPWQRNTWVIKLLNWDLVISRGVAGLDIRRLDQCLLVLEDLLQKGGGHHVVGRHIVLPTLKRLVGRVIGLTIVLSGKYRRNFCRRSVLGGRELEAFASTPLFVYLFVAY